MALRGVIGLRGVPLRHHVARVTPVTPGLRRLRPGYAGYAVQAACRRHTRPPVTALWCSSWWLVVARAGAVLPCRYNESDMGRPRERSSCPR